MLPPPEAGIGIDVPANTDLRAPGYVKTHP